MNWKGIPYSPDIHEITKGIVSVEIEKLPVVLVETPFSWEMVITAFIAALLPSAIAIYTISKNYKLAKFQNRAQLSMELYSKFKFSAATFITKCNIAVQLADIMNYQERIGESEKNPERRRELNTVVKECIQERNNLLILLNRDDELHNLLIDEITSIRECVNKIISPNGVSEDEFDVLYNEFEDSARRFSNHVSEIANKIELSCYN